MSLALSMGIETDNRGSLVISASFGTSKLELLDIELSDVCDILKLASSLIIGIVRSSVEDRKLPGLDRLFLGGRAGGMSPGSRL